MSKSIRIDVDRARLMGNLVWYQSIWFMAILGRESYELIIVALIMGHIALQQDWRRELATVLACGSLGIMTDSLLTAAGLFQFSPAPQVLPVPLWLMGLWYGFAGALRHSLRWLMARPLVASGLGLFGAPFSYMGGVKFGAVSFPQGALLTAVVIGFCWAVMLQIFARFIALSSQEPVSRLEPDSASAS